jgi:hypothetical protein
VPKLDAGTIIFEKSRFFLRATPHWPHFSRRQNASALVGAGILL